MRLFVHRCGHRVGRDFGGVRPMALATYGENIYAIGAVVDTTLKRAGYTQDARAKVLAEISAAQSYDAAIEICRRYINVRREKKS
jgi:hypothetical protein